MRFFLILITVNFFQLAIANAATKDSQPTDSDKQQNQFIPNLQKWVDTSLIAIGDVRTRYVLERIGCVTHSDTKGNEDSRNEKKTKNVTSPISIEQDIADCKEIKPNFYCETTLKLIDDIGVEENSYSYYCRDQKK